MKKTILSVAIIYLLALTTACQSEGTSLNAQKTITFSLTQKGANDQWEIVNHISGDYYNVEKIYQSVHSLEIKPKTDIKNDEVYLTIIVNGQPLESFDSRTEGDKQSKFKAEKDGQDLWKLEKELSHFDNNDIFWDDVVSVVIEYDGMKEEIELQ